MIVYSRRVAATTLALAAAVVAIGSAPVQASVHFTLSDVDVTANSGNGLIINTALASALPESFTLNGVGDSHTFDLFHIGTSESSAQLDDYFAQPISVEFTFSAPPPGFGGDAGGETGTSLNFGSVWFVPIWQAFGNVEWDGPVVLPFGVGGLLQIALSDETFNTGDWTIVGLDPEFGDQGATVSATFTLLSQPTPSPAPEPADAPEPTSLLVWGGLALAGLTAGRRRSRRAEA